MSLVMQGRSTGRYTVELVHPSGAVIRTMAPRDNGGDGSSFSPTDLCAVSLGACATTIMRMFADSHDLPLAGVEFVLEKTMGAGPRRIERIAVTYRLAGTASERDFDRIAAAGRACPVRVTLGDRVAIEEVYVRVEG